MKKLLFVLGILISFHRSDAQDTIRLRQERIKKRVVTDRPPQVVFLELGGPGAGASVNYDRRAANRTDGLGYRAGLGIDYTDQYKLYSVPLGVNFLVGNERRGRFFECGISQSFVHVEVDDAWKRNYNNYNNNNFLFSYSSPIRILSEDVTDNVDLFPTALILGYRSQPVKGGFCFRVGAMPYTAYRSAPNTFWYMSFGYNF